MTNEVWMWDVVCAQCECRMDVHNFSGTVGPLRRYEGEWYGAIGELRSGVVSAWGCFHCRVAMRIGDKDV